MLLLLPLLMAWSLIASNQVVNGTTGTSTIAIDSVGASLIVAISSATRVAHAPGLSDNLGNTWTQLIAEDDGTDNTWGGLTYVQNPTVGSNQVISLSSDVNNSVVVMAFSNAATSDVADQSNYNFEGETTAIPTGSITPTQNDCLVIAGLATVISGVGNITINDSFTVVYQFSGNNSDYANIAAAYFVQSTAAAIEPTWTTPGDSSSQTSVGMIADFNPAPAAAIFVPPPRRIRRVISSQLVRRYSKETSDASHVHCGFRGRSYCGPAGPFSNHGRQWQTSHR